MIRIRFHGRGGHGVKTAARIVGTAAFLAGRQVQDSPVYGAERRGAAVTASARIDQAPILERGVIDTPDLIVIADETLLDDRGAAVLRGQESASAVFVNAAGDRDLSQQHAIKPRVLTLDLTRRTLETLGKASALSAGLAAAAARLIGIISEEQLIAAVREELGELHAAEDLIEKNVQIARAVFNALPVIPVVSRATQIMGAVQSVPYDEAALGTANIVAPGNARQQKTGAWRVERPEIDYDVCTKCGLCVLGCPDAAIALDKSGFPIIDYDHCKGCMICAQLCPLQGIARIKEVQAW